MKVTSKGQVTIPQHIRELLGIHPHSEVDFLVEADKVVLVKTADPKARNDEPFAQVLGIASAGLSTDEIMALTRGG
ncbi:MAG: AbrB/MazE/SpoVT family DNA-binding domain-containing protein [Trueperaceae bacterium]|nr:MAG: AbrB/MazE/SpoVT family DNA-binding domain-containing protein [Trueperaceae bacterium]